MSDEEREPAKATIKVVDRRRFTAEGQKKEGASERAEPPRRSPPSAPPGDGRAPVARRQPPATPPQAATPHGPGSAEPGPRLEFLPFIASLATNALAALGVLPEGQGGPMPRDPRVAREYIDIIVMLERRTRGNLTPEEARTMTQLVADLQVQYVEATRQVQPARGLGNPPGFAATRP